MRVYLLRVATAAQFSCEQDRQRPLWRTKATGSGSEHARRYFLVAETVGAAGCGNAAGKGNRVGRTEPVENGACACRQWLNPVGRKEDEMSTKSFIAKPAEVERKWYVIDADGKNLGRMASQIAAILRGKNKPTYTPHVDCGDYVIVINAEKVAVTGKKRQEKIYKRHSGYPGGLKETNFEDMMAKHPTEAVRHAVKGMMPNGRLGRQMYKKLKVYAGPEHNHAAQKPEVLDIK